MSMTEEQLKEVRKKFPELFTHDDDQRGILIVGSGKMPIPPDIQAKIDSGEIIVVDNVHELKRTDLHHADVERLVAMQVEETKQRIEIQTNPDTGIALSGNENRRLRRQQERRAKKFAKRKR